MAAKKRRSMQDGLENLMTGMGTDRDARSFTTYTNIEIAQSQLDIAYRNDWIARKVVDLPAFDSTREWRAWQAEKDQITLLEEAETKFNLLRKTMVGIQKARLYGGAALVMGVNQGKPSDPLDIEHIKKDDLKFIHVVSRYEITAGPVEADINSEFYGEPQYYERNPVGTVKAVRLHPSRVVRFIGNERFDTLANMQWGDPVLQVVSDAIKMCGTVSASVAALVDESKIDVISIPGLTDNIQDVEYESRLKSRFGLAATAKSVYRLLLLDKEETWERITTAFTALPDVIKMYLLIASGAADIPATRMLGQSPQGLSATGESDTRNYYDRIATEQKTVLQPTISRLDEVLIRSVLGSRPEELHYSWNPLWQMDDAQTAEVALKKAQAFKIDVDSGVIDPQVLREARQNQLIEDGTYPGLEQTIADFEDDMEDLSPEAIAASEAEASKNALALAGAKPALPGKPKALPPPKATADAMAKRVRRALSDATPRTLYVYRPVLNWKDIAKWAKANGIATTIGKDMHVTLAYSRVPIDWMKIGEPWYGGDDDKGNLTIKPGGVRLVEKMGNDEVIALLFTSSALSARWCQMKEAGADWKYPEFQPHITITYSIDPNLDVADMPAYVGEIVLGPEVFETIGDGSYKEEIVEDGIASMQFGGRKPKAPEKTLSATDVEGIVRTVMKDAAPPNITVPVTVNMPKGATKKVTRVTKTDAKGRIQEFESEGGED